MIIYSFSKLSAIYLLVFLDLCLTGALIGNIVASILGLITAKYFSNIPKSLKKIAVIKSLGMEH